MKFEVTTNAAAGAASLAGLRKQVTYATAMALTATAGKVRDAERAAMLRQLKAPTPYTLNGLKAGFATASRLEATVIVKDQASGDGIPPAWYLLPQVEGVDRHVKRFEAALQAGGFMPRGTHAVPTRAAPRDVYGNVSRGEIVKILSQLRAFTGKNARLNLTTAEGRAADNKRRIAMGKAGGEYVALPKGWGKLPPGIYKVTGRDFGAKLGYGRSGPLVAIFVFKNATQYRQRLDFYGVGREIAETEFPGAYADALRKVSDAFERRAAGSAA